MQTRIKICCISSIAEAQLAIQNGASAIGLVSEMPSGPGVITEERISEITPYIPPGIASFLLTCSQDTESIIRQQRYCKVNTIQICDKLTKGTYQDLKEAMPGISLVQVIHVSGEESIIEAQAVSEQVNAILLDSGNQSLAVKELGGTGRTHDWSISRRIVQDVMVPVFLAGGLNPENVGEAVKSVRPYGVDVCSGVRVHDRLNEKKLEHFCAEVETAYTIKLNN